MTEEPRPAPTTVVTVDDGIARISWVPDVHEGGLWAAVDVVRREVSEELGLEIAAGALVLTDWLPPWGGWDDALCLVFDGGTHEASILEHVVREEREIRHAEFCTVEQVRERAADFTARRVEAALANLRGEGGTPPSYTESGR